MFKEYDFKSGDIIVFCEEEFEVIENYGNHGKVKDIDGVEIGVFYWNYQGEECTLK